MTKRLTKTPYAIGYQKPPRQSQFAPGQSGNPNGRPRGSKSFAALVRKELRQRIGVHGSNGKAKTVTKEQAMVVQLVNNALREPKNIPALIRVLGVDSDNEASKRVAEVPPDRAEDKKTIESIVRRIRQMAAEPPSQDLQAAPAEKPSEA